jgi:hypothetical protein
LVVIRRKYLFTVEHVARIPGRGWLLSPGVLPTEALRVGERLVLERPDGSVKSVLSMGTYAFCVAEGEHVRDKTLKDVLISFDIPKEDVPVGTRVLVEVAD